MSRGRVLPVVYLVSGAAGLVYEVIWLRLLTMTMGHTSGAVGSVLAAFMGGLAIGAWAGGRAAQSIEPRRALHLYAALEIVIAVCALLLAPALYAIRVPLAAAYADGSGGVVFDSVRVIVSVVLIAIPAIAMGATYPVAIAANAGASPGSQSAGRLYAANTIGAAAGAALTGFLFLPALGLFGTTLVGVALNALAALGALSISSGYTHLATVESATNSRHGPGSASQLPLAALVLAVSGFVALVYEVAWTRILAMILGPTTYAFSAMLVAFISGLAIGAAAATALMPKLRRPGVWLGGAVLAAAAAAAFVSTRVDQLPLTIAAVAGRPGVEFGSVFALQVVLAIAMLLPVSIALGATLPLAVALAAGAQSQVSRSAATVYAANTAGAIAGALTSSFLLIPHFGLQRTVQVASLIAVVTGLAAAWRSLTTRAGKESERRRLLITSSFGVVAVASILLLLPAWNHERLANGAYRFAPSLAAGDIATGLEAGDLAYYREGSAGTVSVKRLLGVTSLAIDGKVDASNGADMLTQKLLAHLPLLLHEQPRSVYVIGLGSGVTLGAALRHPIEHAVVSEISPEVVAASDQFRTENHDALRDPRTRLIVGDGRSHLLLSDARYDVIISEPSNPWMAGVSTLFTREFFLAARSRLRPGGILCQWTHTYNISDGDLRSIVATFLSAFPDGSAWLVGEGDLLLIGSTTPLRALEEGIAGAWSRPGVAADLAQTGVRDPFSLLSTFVARDADLSRYAEGAAIQTDGRLSLEFSAPRAVYGQFEQNNVKRLRAVASAARPPDAVARVRATATADEWRHRAQMDLSADSPDLAYDEFLEALSRAPNDRDALDGLARAAAAAGRLPDAEAYLTKHGAGGGSVAALIELSKVLAARGEADKAALTAQRGAALDPSNADALEQLIVTLADSGNDTALEQLSALLKQSMPEGALAVRSQMRLAYLRSDYAHAARLGERLVSLTTDTGDRARTLNLVGSAYEATGDHDRARKAFQDALAIAPRDSAVLVNLGMTELRSANAQGAEARFSEALFLYPTLKPALDGLAQALQQQGQTGRATAIRALTDRN